MTTNLFFDIFFHRTEVCEKEAKMLNPVYRETLWGAVEITVFGAVRNWNFAGQSAEDIETRNPEVIADLQEIMRELKIKRALVPKPSFNARVVGKHELTYEIFPNFFRGADADGVIITKPGDAYFLASADCLTALIYDEHRHRLAGLHCGRNALVDRDALAGKSARASASVIDGAFSAFRYRGLVYPRQLRAFLAAGIGPAFFTHPTTETMTQPDGQVVLNRYRDQNRALIEHLSKDDAEWVDESGQSRIIHDFDQGQIDLVGIVQAQLRGYGVPLDSIDWDGHDTATDRDANGNYIFHSYRRDPSKRNLVVVKLID